MVFSGDNVVGSILRPIIDRKHRHPRQAPSWSQVAKLVETYTQRNEIFLAFLDSFDEQNLKEVFDLANQHLKDWAGVETRLTDPQVKRAVAGHLESVRRTKLKARGILERDVRTMISRSAVDRMAAKR